MAPEPQTLTEVLERRRASDHGVGFLDDSLELRSVTFGELASQARAWAGALRDRGVGAGDRVALLGSTSPEFVACIFGVWHAGAVAVPLAIPTRIPDPAGLLASLKARAAHAQVALLAADAALSALADLSQLADNVATFDELASGLRDVEAADVGPSDPMLLQYTSGSTGAPKGAVISHGAMLGNAIAAKERGRMTHSDVVVSWLPLFHDFGLIGMTLWPLIVDMPTYLMRPETFIASPGRWTEAMSRFGATITAAPNFAYSLAARALRATRSTLDLSAIRMAANGAEPIDADTMDAFASAGQAHGLDASCRFPVYGLAEATLGVTTPQPGDPLSVVEADPAALVEGTVRIAEGPGARRIVSVGTAINGVRVEIRDSSGSAVADGRVGEICVETDYSMTAYWRDPAATAAVLRDGTIHTGDLGAMVDGNLIVTGRTKDMIIVAGRNLYPEDAERAAQQVAAVRRGNAVAFAGKGRRGETVIVVAETRAEASDAQQAAGEVSASVRSALGVRPEVVVLIRPGSLPKTPSGKLQRSHTRDMFMRGELEAVTVAQSAAR